MAKASKKNVPSKELQRFSNDLLFFIWESYGFENRTLELSSYRKSKYEKEHLDGCVIHFKDEIGIAVLCTQSLLRDFCCFYLKCFGSELLNNERITKHVYFIIIEWIKIRKTDIFLKIIDAAAIVAETCLYCFYNLNAKVKHYMAARMLSKVIYSKSIKSPFFKNGGWKRLQDKAYDDFLYLKMILERIINLRNMKYQKLNYDCKLIEYLENSPVWFPVENSKFCEKCEIDISRKRLFYFKRPEIFTTTQDFRELPSEVDAPQEELSTKVAQLKEEGSSKNDLHRDKGFSKDDQSKEAICLSLSKCDITRDSKKLYEITGTFIFRLLGNQEDLKSVDTKQLEVKAEVEAKSVSEAESELEDKPELEDKAENVEDKVEKPKKKKKKRKTKSKAKSGCAQYAKQTPEISETLDLETGNLQSTEESCED